MLRIKDAIKILDVSQSWIDKAIKEGAIKVVWLGGVRRISDKEMDRIKREGVTFDEDKPI